MNKLLIENISVQYKNKKEIVPVIDRLSLHVEQGECLVVLGPSGCGKSTLINALAGTIALSGGLIDYIKDDVRQALSPTTHKIGIIPQNCGLLPWKTVRANCLLPLAIRHESIGEQRKKEIEQIESSLGLSRLMERYPKELSGGQIQRAAIARAFIQQPDLLLMDEPFSSLDAIKREEAQKLFLETWTQFRPTTMLVTHSIEEALYLGNTILVMGAHRGEICYQMQNPYAAQLHPQSTAYGSDAKLLREKLQPSDGRPEQNE